jgi:hypothetical protein
MDNDKTTIEERMYQAESNICVLFMELIQARARIETLEHRCEELKREMDLKLDSTGSAHTAKTSAAVKEVPMVLPQVVTESQRPTMAESLPPPSPSPSEPASISPELELSLQRIAEAASVRQGTPLPERYLSTHASISFAKPIVKPKSGA